MGLWSVLVVTLLSSAAVMSEDDMLKLLRTEEVLSAANELSLSIVIDQGRDVLELNLFGPADVYYAVGFGSTTMHNTWAIVVNGEGDDGWFEQTLSDHSPGVTLEVKSFELLQNSLSPQTNNLRHVHLRRELSSMNWDHPFDATQDSIDIIWAIGSDNTFSHHTESGTKTLLYSIMDTMVPHLPSDVWLYDGTVNISAMVVIIGMGSLFVALVVYYGWNWYKSRHRDSNEMEKETDALLSHQQSDAGDLNFIAL